MSSDKMSRESNILKTRERREKKQQKKRELRELNQKLRANRTNAEQLALLDMRLGKGVGAKKERKRLSN